MNVYSQTNKDAKCLISLVKFLIKYSMQHVLRIEFLALNYFSQLPSVPWFPTFLSNFNLYGVSAGKPIISWMLHADITTDLMSTCRTWVGKFNSGDTMALSNLHPAWKTQIYYTWYYSFKMWHNLMRVKLPLLPPKGMVTAWCSMRRSPPLSPKWEPTMPQLSHISRAVQKRLFRPLGLWLNKGLHFSNDFSLVN